MIGPNGKGASSTSAGAPETHENQHANFASDGTVGKAFAALQGRAAHCGRSLHEPVDSAFLVGRRNYPNAVPRLRAVGGLLRQIGGRV